MPEAGGSWDFGACTGQLADGDAMMLIVVAEESELVVLENDLCTEEGLVEVDRMDTAICESATQVLYHALQHLVITTSRMLTCVMRLGIAITSTHRCAALLATALSECVWHGEG